MLQIIGDEQIRQLAPQNGDANNAIMRQHTCPELTYRAENGAINLAATHFGLQNVYRTAHGARIGAATAQWAENEDINAIKLAGGWKSQNAADLCIRNGGAEIATLDIVPESQYRILKAHGRFTKRIN